MGLSIDRAERYRKSADYVNLILRGTRPADLPIDEPTAFELVVNLKTAGILGLTIPPSVLLRATRLIA
jgi:putative ABC transport system substrate-binding protein